MYAVGDSVRLKDDRGFVRDATVVRVDDKHWVYLDLKDDDGCPYMFPDIKAKIEAGRKDREKK